MHRNHSWWANSKVQAVQIPVNNRQARGVHASTWEKPTNPRLNTADSSGEQRYLLKTAEIYNYSLDQDSDVNHKTNLHDLHHDQPNQAADETRSVFKPSDGFRSTLHKPGWPVGSQDGFVIVTYNSDDLLQFFSKAISDLEAGNLSIHEFEQRRKQVVQDSVAVGKQSSCWIDIASQGVRIILNQENIYTGHSHMGGFLVFDTMRALCEGANTLETDKILAEMPWCIASVKVPPSACVRRRKGGISITTAIIPIAIKKGFGTVGFGTSRLPGWAELQVKRA
mmetsp:Transcript_22115/g.34676  ORF Transcript_22115/g.34676 Transcript_22115/m.34676 type:complete len:281 (+) Transcript_22115:355-1197(+)